MPDRTDELLTPKQVAALFSVTPKTVSRWATEGKIRSATTLGGHRRYHKKEVYELFSRHGGQE